MIHIVIGAEGEYSDRHEYIAGAFTDIEVAKKLVIEKTATGRQRAVERMRWLDKRKALSDKLKQDKINAVDAKTLAYYGRDYLPSRLTWLSNVEQDELDRQMGPYPEAIEYDQYYVVSVPVDEWGRWEELYEENKGTSSYFEYRKAGKVS